MKGIKRVIEEYIMSCSHEIETKIELYILAKAHTVSIFFTTLPTV